MGYFLSEKMNLISFYFLLAALFFLLNNSAFSKKIEEGEIYEPQYNLEVSGVWQAKINNPSKNCDYFLITNKEPSQEESPALTQINGDFFSFDYVKGKLDKKKINVKKGEKIFVGLDFNKNQRTTLTKLQCEFIRDNGGHPAANFRVSHAMHTLQLVMIGYSQHENKNIVNKMKLSNNQKDSFKRNISEKTFQLVSGNLFISFFPKGSQPNLEQIYPIRGFIKGNKLILSVVESDPNFGTVNKVITLNLTFTKDKKLEGIFGDLLPFNEIVINSPVIYKKMLSLKKR